MFILPKEKKDILNLPRRPERSLLPAPHISLVPSLLLLAIPILFVGVYALWPWFNISDVAVRVIVWLVMILFLVANLGLFVILVRVFLMLVRQRRERAAQANGSLFLFLIFILSILFFSFLIIIVQPIYY